MSVITGASLSTPMKRPNMAQTDPKKSDYIKNNPLAGVSEADNGKVLAVENGVPAFVPASHVESHTLQDSKDYTDQEIAKLQLDKLLGVTEEDNGKAIVVQDGKPAIGHVSTIANIEGTPMNISVCTKKVSDARPAAAKKNLLEIITDDAPYYSPIHMLTDATNAYEGYKGYFGDSDEESSGEMMKVDANEDSGFVLKDGAEIIVRPNFYVDNNPHVTAYLWVGDTGLKKVNIEYHADKDGWSHTWCANDLLRFRYVEASDQWVMEKLACGQLLKVDIDEDFVLEHGTEILACAGVAIDFASYAYYLQVGETGSFPVVADEGTKCKKRDILRFEYDTTTQKWLLTENLTQGIVYEAAWKDLTSGTPLTVGAKYEVAIFGTVNFSTFNAFLEFRVVQMGYNQFQGLPKVSHSSDTLSAYIYRDKANDMYRFNGYLGRGEYVVALWGDGSPKIKYRQVK